MYITVRETPPYPPTAGEFAVYRLVDAESRINYAVTNVGTNMFKNVTLNIFYSRKISIFIARVSFCAISEKELALGVRQNFLT